MALQFETAGQISACLARQGAMICHGPRGASSKGSCVVIQEGFSSGSKEDARAAIASKAGSFLAVHNKSCSPSALQHHHLLRSSFPNPSLPHHRRPVQKHMDLCLLLSRSFSERHGAQTSLPAKHLCGHLRVLCRAKDSALQTASELQIALPGRKQCQAADVQSKHI